MISIFQLAFGSDPQIFPITGGVTVNDAAQLIYSLLWEERPVAT